LSSPLLLFPEVVTTADSDGVIDELTVELMTLAIATHTKRQLLFDAHRTVLFERPQLQGKVMDTIYSDGTHYTSLLANLHLIRGKEESSSKDPRRCFMLSAY